jgi:hypothetical protein
MMPPVSSRSARDDTQYLNDEAGMPADSTIAAHCNDRDFGTSQFGRDAGAIVIRRRPGLSISRH